MTTEYQTRDFYAAAFLIACGNKIVSHSRSGTITTFLFVSTDELVDQIDKYYRMKAMVEPISFGNSIKSLKTVIHSYQTNSNSNSNGGKLYGKAERNKTLQ